MFRRNARSYQEFQQHVSGALLWWGGTNMLAGAALLLARNTVLRQFGVQALVWGGIDAALALFGRRSAARNRRPVAVQARSFQRLVAVNAVLDVLYVAGGYLLVSGAQGREARVGAGLGIMVQGAFLLLFDSALTLLARRWTADR